MTYVRAGWSGSEWNEKGKEIRTTTKEDTVASFSAGASVLNWTQQNVEVRRLHEGEGGMANSEMAQTQKHWMRKGRGKN